LRRYEKPFKAGFVSNSALNTVIQNTLYFKVIYKGKLKRSTKQILGESTALESEQLHSRSEDSLPSRNSKPTT
jgi:hypothetical protein